MERSSSEIDEEKTKKQIELKEACELRHIVAGEIYVKEKELLDLKEKKRKAQHTIGGLRQEIEILTSEFWRTKNEGL